MAQSKRCLAERDGKIHLSKYLKDRVAACELKEALNVLTALGFDQSHSRGCARPLVEKFLRFEAWKKRKKSKNPSWHMGKAAVKQMDVQLHRACKALIATADRLALNQDLYYHEWFFEQINKTNYVPAKKQRAVR